MAQQLLVVEDYADLGSAITAALPDYACTTVRTADEAIKNLRTHQYDSILLSPRLPIKEDPVMHFLLENQPAEVRKVILMTYPDAETPIDECRVLMKPFGFEELVAELGRRD